MIVFYKNYKRTDRVLLSIQSVKHLFPEIEIYCLMLYDNDKSEYAEYIDKFTKLDVKVFFDIKTYNFGTSGAEGSTHNGFYFTEGVNKMQKICVESNISDKVLMLDEDHFFTTGKTINYLLSSDFDLAVGWWPAPTSIKYKSRPSFEPNASIICINPISLNDSFPIEPAHEYVEILFGFELVQKSVNNGKKVVEIPTRKYTNFDGDGIHTNNIEDIKRELTLANIPFIL